MKPFLLLSSLAAMLFWSWVEGGRIVRSAPSDRGLKIEAVEPQISRMETSSPAIAQDAWQSLSRPQSGFNVAMPPGTVREEVKPLETEFGTVDNHLLIVSQPTGFYALLYRDFPAALENWSPEAVLNAMIEGVEANVSRKLQDPQTIALDGNPGADLYYESFDGFTYKQRVYVVDRRLYILAAATAETASESFVAEADRFLNSFELNLETP